MGFIGLLIAIVVLILIFTFTYFSNTSPSLTPEKSTEIIKEAEEVMDNAEEKSQLEEDLIKNIDQL